MEVGFVEDQKFYNREPKRMRAAFKSINHYAEVFKESSDWNIVFIYGPGFMNGPVPKRFDLLEKKDYKEMEKELKKKL